MSLILNNIVIESREGDNFINATQLCKAGGKQFKHWISLDSTKELLEVLKNSLIEVGRDPDLPLLIDIRRSGPNNQRGSWVHPDLAIPLAQWLSPKFAIKVSRWMRELITTGEVKIESNKTNEELLELQKQVHEKDLKLLEMEKNIKMDKETLQYQMEAVKHFVSFTKRTKKSNNYTGSTNTDHNIYNQKYGKANSTDNRKKALSTGNSIANEFQMRYTYEIPDDLAKPLETFMHKIFEPLSAKTRDKSSIEFFMVHDKFLHAIAKDLAQHVNNYSDLINEYITKLEENEMNFKKLDDWVNRKYDSRNLSTIHLLNNIFEREDNLEVLEALEIKDLEIDKCDLLVEPITIIEEPIKLIEPIESPIKEIPPIKEEIKMEEQKEEKKEEVKESLLSEEHKTLLDELKHLKEDIIQDIRIEGERNYVCKIKIPNSHSAPESHYTRSQNGNLNHYCQGCKLRKKAIEDLETKIKEITHRKCSDCGNQKPISNFSLRTSTAFYASCNSCLGRRSRNLSKKDALLDIFNGINKETLSPNDVVKLEYLTQELNSLSKESLKNKKAINILGNHKRCSLSLSHPSDELSRWLPTSAFGKDFRCKSCRSVNNRNQPTQS